MICQHCGEEVRFGWRTSRPGWWHREEKDHEAFPIVGPETERPSEIPPVEIPCHPMNPDDLAPRSGIRQIFNLVKKTPEWDVYRLTHSRGPYIGSKGEVLSISDSIVLGARQNVGLDGTYRIAVASWRDSDFDFAYIGTVADGKLHPHRVNSTDMKGWIKGTYEPPASHSND